MFVYIIYIYTKCHYLSTMSFCYFADHKKCYMIIHLQWLNSAVNLSSDCSPASPDKNQVALLVGISSHLTGRWSVWEGLKTIFEVKYEASVCTQLKLSWYLLFVLINQICWKGNASNFKSCGLPLQFRRTYSNFHSYSLEESMLYHTTRFASTGYH